MGEEYAASVDDDLKEELDLSRVSGGLAELWYSYLKSPCGENSEIKRKAKGNKSVCCVPVVNYEVTYLGGITSSRCKIQITANIVQTSNSNQIIII
jgi:hypothetical protein